MILQPKYLAMFIVLLSLSCQSKGQQALNSCGEIKKLVFDADYAKAYGLPEIEFEVQYPSTMQADLAADGKRNLNYASFYSNDEAGNRKEMVSIGYYTLEGDLGKTIDALNESLISQIRSIYVNNFDLSFEFSGKKEFSGKEYHMFQAIGSIDRPEAHFAGTYHVQALLIRPTPTADTGVIFIFQTNENSEITSLDDLGKKGCSAIIWNSLKFKE